jgi:hypothetical protein
LHVPGLSKHGPGGVVHPELQDIGSVAAEADTVTSPDEGPEASDSDPDTPPGGTQEFEYLSADGPNRRPDMHVWSS